MYIVLSTNIVSCKKLKISFLDKILTLDRNLDKLDFDEILNFFE